MKHLLTEMHSGFIKRANQSTIPSSLPIDAREPRVPVLAVQRWREHEGVLTKVYQFRRPQDKREFVSAVLGYEIEVGHNADIVIREDTVELNLTTHDLGKPTEIDKEYAAFADTVFKDLVYNPRYEDGSGYLTGSDERLTQGSDT